MVDLLLAVGRLFTAIFLVLLNGFFVASEFAFVRIRSTSVDQMIEEGRRGSKTLQEALDSLDDYLAATQLGITVASLGLGWTGSAASPRPATRSRWRGIGSRFRPSTVAASSGS